MGLFGRQQDAELTQAYDASRERFDLPRATVGMDVFAPDLTNTLELTVGAFSGLGAPPQVTPGGVALHSEFGTYGDLAYVQISAFF